MPRAVPVGRYETVLMNGEGTVLPGNSKPGLCVGLSMGLIVKVNVRKTGRRRWDSAGNANYFNRF
jgi:hypothetical protein